MSSEEFKNPEDVFKAFSKEMENFSRGFVATQGHEMIKEFSKAWSALGSQYLEQPQEWLDMWLDYQRKSTDLWLQTLGMMPRDPENPPVKAAPADRRFKDESWDEQPVFSYLKQSYLLASEMLNKVAQSANLDEQNQKKLEFYTRYTVDAMSPSNFALTNPEVIQQALETKGQSLIDGLQNLLKDMEKGRISMTDESAFELGKNLAITPGSVVFENAMFQLIQYQPTTEEVSKTPLLIVPPFINKFYILDLQEKNSFVKYALDQGYRVFLMSWVNPDAELADCGWDDYIEKGVFTALEVVKKITRAKQMHTVSWCVGGTLLATALAVLSARGEAAQVASATYLTTLLDFSDPGDLGVFIDEAQLEHRKQQLQHSGVLSGKDLATAFSMLRANDLIWSYVVNNYLKGQQPTPFDILYWNSDPTNLPAGMYTYYLRNMYIDNKLIEPGGLNLCGEAIELGKIKTPSYFLSTRDDHIAPWKTTFAGTRLFGGPVEFVLGASGHIAGVINPVSKNKRNYWINGKLGEDAEAWMDSAESVPGSWWPHWSEWLAKQGDNQAVKAPKTLGNKEFPAIEAAPGRYVMKRIN